MIVKTCGKYVEDCSINGGGSYPLEAKIFLENVGGKEYFLKRSVKSSKNLILDGENFLINEYISSKIFESLNIECEKVFLYKIGDEIVLCIQNFLEKNEKLIKFYEIKNDILSRERVGYGTELNDILYVINEQNLVDKVDFLSHFWKMFIVDALIGNFDRNIGKFGIIKNEITGKYRISPIFENNTTLFPQTNFYKKDLEEIFYKHLNSSFKQNNKQINYYEFFKKVNDKNCKNELKNIRLILDMEKIYKIIDEIKIISNQRKELLKNILKLRYENIIRNA